MRRKYRLEIRQVESYLLQLKEAERAENIIRDFKLNSESGVTMRFAKSLFQTIMNHMTEKTDMLFQEWQEMIHLSENDKGQNLDISKGVR